MNTDGTVTAVNRTLHVQGGSTMQGYFIYTKYNKQHTWAGAKKTGIVECSPDMVEEYREKAFFDDLRMICAASTDTLPLGRSNLWFYHPWQGATVIAKSTMVSDPQKEGENIPYAMGYYLTEEDHEAFLHTPEAFGQEEQFETYANYQKRIADQATDQQDSPLARIGNAHPRTSSFQTIWNQLGFTKYQFYHYFKALVKSIDNTDDAEVILHLNAEEIKEEILLSTMKVLPKHLRELFGAVSNWSDEMNKETIPRAFTLVCFDARESENKLEISNGTLIPPEGLAASFTPLEKKYMEWIWDTVEQTTKREEFTYFLRSHFPTCLTEVSYANEMSCYYFMKMAEMLNNKSTIPNNELFYEVKICIRQTIMIFPDQMPGNIFLQRLMKNCVNILLPNARNKDMISEMPLKNIFTLDSWEVEGAHELLKQLFIIYYQTEQQEQCRHIVKETGETAWWDLDELHITKQELKSTEINQQTDQHTQVKSSEKDKEVEGFHILQEEYLNNRDEETHNNDTTEKEEKSYGFDLLEDSHSSDTEEITDNKSKKKHKIITSTFIIVVIIGIVAVVYSQIKDKERREEQYYREVQILREEQYSASSVARRERQASSDAAQTTTEEADEETDETDASRIPTVEITSVEGMTITYLSDSDTTYNGYYSGEVKDGKPNGEGEITYGENEFNVESYTGSWIDGQRSGQGTMKWSDGTIYKGSWENDSMNGQGIYYFPKDDENGSDYYDGEWIDGKQSGQGTMKWLNGTIYEGAWENNLRNGQGIHYFPEDDENGREYYDGEWIDDKRTGQGTMKWLDGGRYEGAWENNLRNGQGIYYFPEDDVSGREYYDGEWIDDKRTGHGTMKWLYGAIYEGAWENGSRHGQGIYYFPEDSENGSDYYDGEWIDDKQSGLGTYTWVDSSKYVGIWQDGKRHGTGVLTDEYNNVFNQVYSNGELISSTPAN
jgi:hypothetical protein